MAASLQRKAFWGMVWNFAESFSLQIIQFIIGIFMARPAFRLWDGWYVVDIFDNIQYADYFGFL